MYTYFWVPPKCKSVGRRAWDKTMDKKPSNGLDKEAAMCNTMW